VQYLLYFLSSGRGGKEKRRGEKRGDYGFLLYKRQRKKKGEPGLLLYILLPGEEGARRKDEVTFTIRPWERGKNSGRSSPPLLCK